MLVECASKVVEPVKTFVYNSIRDYVGHIGSCEDNLSTLQKNLSDVCYKKDDIIKKVKEGEDNLEKITGEAESWLKYVSLLTKEVELRSLIYRDIETAKFVVMLMEKKDLKKLVRKDGEMQKLVVQVMKKLVEEMEKSEDEMREMAKLELDYKMVAEVVVEVMKDTIEEFKKLMKKDKKMAVSATELLKDSDLEKLTKDDKEMEDILREAGSVSDEDLCQNAADEDEEGSNVLLVSEVAVDKNILLEAATKLLIPLGNLLSRVGKLMGDAKFRTAVPEAEHVKLRLDVIDG